MVRFGKWAILAAALMLGSSYATAKDYCCKEIKKLSGGEYYITCNNGQGGTLGFSSKKGCWVSSPGGLEVPYYDAKSLEEAAEMYCRQ